MQVKTYDEITAECVKTYSFRFAENEYGILEELDDELDLDAELDRVLDGDLDQEAETTPGDALHRKALEFQYQHPDTSYPTAVEKVMAVNPDLAHAYAGEVNGLPARTYQQADRGDDPSLTIHERALDFMDQTDEEDYAVAVEHVLEASPHLNRAYGGYVSEGS
ncbi:MAG: hypothetical protein IH994_02485 [Proteobacteria bacterium]|nr:hypothetical protein [Pseudomonadota bacterium]